MPANTAGVGRKLCIKIHWLRETLKFSHRNCGKPDKNGSGIKAYFIENIKCISGQLCHLVHCHEHNKVIKVVERLSRN